MTRPNPFLDVTIIVETFNLSEGSGLDWLARVFQYVDGLRKRRPGVQVMLADSSDSGSPGEVALARLILNYPDIRVLRVPGGGYDGVKGVAAQVAQTKYIVYLDGDCVPQDDTWLESLLAPLHDGTAEATAGTTLYETETLWSRTLSLMDFGFLLEPKGGPLGCYASNNVAFLRSRRLSTPPPQGALRCTCYAHGQELARQNAAILHVAQAVVRHKLPRLFAERWRRGYDLVAICWVDPYLLEKRWLAYGVLAAPLFYFQNVALDWRRMKIGRARFNWGWRQCLASICLVSLIRLIDLAGAARALALGPSRQWQAYGPAALSRLEKQPDRA